MSDKASPLPLYLGIDFGTSGCRAVLISDDGAIHGQAAVTLPAPIRQGNTVQQDPGLWRQGLDALLRQLPAHGLAHTHAIAIDGTSATVLLSDASGQPLSPALMYNDSRASEQATRIAATAPPDSPALGPGSSLAKALWLLEHNTRTPAHILHQADWLSGWLLGRYGQSDENNSLKLGYDPNQRRWPDWVAALLPKPNPLPKVAPAGTPIGTIDAALANQYGLPHSTRIISGTTDSTAAFLATGASEAGDAVTTLGSTLVLKVLSDRPLSSPQHGVYSHRLGDRWLVGGASNSGGAVLRQHFNDQRMAELSRQLDFAQPSGLDYYPLPGPGERFPINDPALAPRTHPRPDDDRRFFQGLLEGIAAIEQRGYKLLQQLGAPWPSRIISSGGGAANRAWGDYRSQRLGIPEVPAAQTEAAYGAALLARRSRSEALTQASTATDYDDSLAPKLPREPMTTSITISHQPVELYKILKFEGLVASGGEAKQVIADGAVKVNGAVERRKRNKIVDGDQIEFQHKQYRIRLA